MNFDSISAFMNDAFDPKHLQTKKKTVTIEQVKSCIVMPEPIKTTLLGLCDVWYKMALQDGKTETEAAEVALDKLSEKMLAMSK